MASEKLNNLLSQGFVEYWIPRSEEEHPANEMVKVNGVGHSNKIDNVRGLYQERFAKMQKVMAQSGW